MVDGPDCLLPSTTSFRPTSIYISSASTYDYTHTFQNIDVQIFIVQFCFSKTLPMPMPGGARPIPDKLGTKPTSCRYACEVRWKTTQSFILRQANHLYHTSLVNYQANWQNRHRSFVCQGLAHCKIHKSSPSLVEVFTMCPKIIYWRWLVKCHVCDYMQC